MRIRINNLGFVKKIDLDLGKDLTILCGPNNTGKTYVAYAIYGLMKYRLEIPIIESLKESIKILLEKGQVEVNLSDLLENSVPIYLQNFAKNYVKQIHQVFASEKTAFPDTKIDITLDDIDKIRESIFSRKIIQVFGIRNSYTIRIEKEVESTNLICLLLDSDSKEIDNNQEIPFSILINFIAERIFNIIIDIIFPKTYIAPAERTAINIFSKELSLKRNILVDKLLELKDVGNDDDPFDLINRRVTRYPLPIRDSLETSEDLNNFKKHKSEFGGFAEEIENEILKGKVIISKEGEVQYNPHKKKSVKLPIHLTASIVKSLSNLVIYFRHLANKGDFIIIDEPELNLHPDNQVIIARIIAKMVNNGFKVLISTHSDYIIREINNLIMLRNKPELIAKYSYSEDTLLDHNRVEAILFHYDKPKCVNIEVSNTGFEVETIDNVISQLNERAENLYFYNESGE